MQHTSSIWSSMEASKSTSMSRTLLSSFWNCRGFGAGGTGGAQGKTQGGGGWISLRIALVFPQILATPLPPPLPPLATPKGVVRSELRVVRSEPRVVKGGKF